MSDEEQTAAPPKVIVVREQEGTVLFRDFGLEADVVAVGHVHIVLLLDGAIRFGGSGGHGREVEVLAKYFMSRPGLLEAVTGMMQLLQRSAAGG